MRHFIILLSLFAHSCTQGSEKKIVLKNDSCDSIMISKPDLKMYVYANKQVVRTYAISIGYNPIGHKQQQGDNRTPEGLYIIEDKNPNSNYFKNLGISYPNQADRANAKKRHVSPGGDIKIHGYADEKGRTTDWNTRYAYTWGCIGLCNRDMDEVFRIVKVGARIYIKP